MKFPEIPDRESGRPNSREFPGIPVWEFPVALPTMTATATKNKTNKTYATFKVRAISNC